MNNRWLPLALLCLSIQAHALSPDPDRLTLLQLYDASRLNDPVMRSADSSHRAAQNEEAIGRGGLLPQLSLSSRYGKGGRTDGGTDASYVDSDDYQSNSLSLIAQQPIYDKGRWAAYQQGKARGELGEVQYQVADQALYDRVAKAYFAVARVENELKLIAQQKAAIAGLVDQSQRLYEKGQGAITDVDEARARYDLVEAQEAENQAQRIAALRTLSGRGSLPLLEIVPMREAPPDNPLNDGHDLGYWTGLAREASPELAARLAEVKVAESEAEAQKAGHYPTLSLTTQLTRRDNSQYEELSPRQDSYYVGLALDIPLYRGGATSASVRKATEALAGAQADADAQRQQLSEDVETAYAGVVAGYAKCRATQRAVESNQRALVSTEKGFQGGVRSTVDILDAQQRLFEARRDLLNAKLDMLQSYVTLHVHTGQMDRAVLAQVEALF
ncbi:TolC family outer membrane protein [Pseudomonas sp. DC3200b2]|uniref:TolC family outer membrane protein n=1 Tax=Pseudomonas sp. DC3200b2 TaxID=2804669 RepID=UPI003CEC18C6